MHWGRCVGFFVLERDLGLVIFLFFVYFGVGGFKSVFGINLQRTRKEKGLLAYSFISFPNLPSLLLIHLELKFGVGGIQNVFVSFFFSFFLCFGFLGLDSGKTSLSTRDGSCGGGACLTRGPPVFGLYGRPNFVTLQLLQ